MLQWSSMQICKYAMKIFCLQCLVKKKKTMDEAMRKESKGGLSKIGNFYKYLSPPDNLQPLPNMSIH